MHSVRFAIIALAIGTCVLAFIKGGRAERGGAILIALNWFAITVSQFLIGGRVPTRTFVGSPALIFDILLAIGFLWLALRYSSLWLGAAMMLQGGQLAVYGSFLQAGAHSARQYAIALNVTGVLVLLTILGGTISSWMQRKRAPDSEVEAAS